MKKIILSLVLALALCLTLTPGAAFAADSDTVIKTAVKFPGSEAEFILENVAAEYVVVDVDGVPEYRIAFPGTDGKITCDSAANVEYSQVFEDFDNPANSGAGGGGSMEPLEPGWSEGYPQSWTGLNGRGLAQVIVAIYEDGTMIYGSDKKPVAYLDFSFGYAISIFGEMPEDMISWEWQQGTSSGGAGGPSQMVPVDIPKLLITDITTALTDGAAAPPAPPAPPAAADEITVLVNGTAVVFDQPPIIENGRTLVPLRAIFEAMGADIDWNPQTRTVTAVRGDVTISLTINSNILDKNSEKIELEVPARIVNDRTLVPARAVAESFGAEVGWEPSTRTVIITE
jgi:hypothetical protein